MSFLPIQATKFPGPYIQNIPLVYQNTFTIDQITNSFSANIEFLPGIAGYIYAPIMGVWLKGGARYNTCPGVIRVIWTGYTTSLPTAAFPAAYVNSVGSATVPMGYLGNSFAVAGIQTAEIAGKGLTLQATVGNPTVNGTNVGYPITLVLYYLLVPVLEGNLTGY